MPSLNFRKFADPDGLRAIAPDRLRALLMPWQDYLFSRGFQFLDVASIDHARLAQVLIAPDRTTPAAMVDALYYVHETASAQDMEDLIGATQRQGIVIPHDPMATPVDLAIDVWLQAPDLLRSRHAEAIAMRQQNFEYFGPTHPVRVALPTVDDAAQLRIQKDLDTWFTEHRRGGGSQIFVIRHPPKTWLLIRHGEPMRREASQQEDGSPGSQVYRPQCHDVLIYDERSGEIGVHAGTKGERTLYLRTLGEVLFNNAEHFPPAAKFTLDPLSTVGSASLAADDVDGIASVRLVEYRRYWGGEHREVETRKAEDIFAALAKRDISALSGGRLVSATFKVRFEDSAKEHSVVIRPPGIARYDRNDDSELIDQWLRKRGFIQTGPDTDDDETPTSVLENS